MKARNTAWKMGDCASRSFYVVATATLCLAALSTPAAARDTPSPGQQFQLALEAQTTGHYEDMLVLLRSASEAGHLPAQEMLGIALLTGPSVYGDAVPADRCEATLWIHRALAQGSEIARHQWAFLGRLRQAPAGTPPCDVSSG